MPVTVRSRHSFRDTISRLVTEINASGNSLFTSIDQSAAAKAAGASLRPTVLLVFGNPKAGTALMDAFPLAALELPLKLLVWETDAGVNVSYVAASEIAARYAVTGKETLVAAMDAVLERMTGSLR